MARFTKYSNPSKKRCKKNMNRADADIMATKNMFDDRKRGIDLPLSFYDEQSDQMCGKANRKIYGGN